MVKLEQVYPKWFRCLKFFILTNSPYFDWHFQTLIYCTILLKTYLHSWDFKKYKYIYISISTYLYLSIYLCSYVSISLYVYIYVYIYIYIYIYITLQKYKISMTRKVSLNLVMCFQRPDISLVRYYITTLCNLALVMRRETFNLITGKWEQ